MNGEHWILGTGIALCLFLLWAIGRHDWLRLTRPSRRVIGEVIGHARNSDDGFAAIFRFSAEGRTHEVTDPVYGDAPQPAVGTLLELNHPEGRPDLARPPHPLTWLFVYATLLAMLAALIARMLGWLPDN